MTNQTLTYTHAASTNQAILLKLPQHEYGVFAPELLGNGTTTKIMRNLKEYSIRFQSETPFWGGPVTYDVATPSGLTTPISSTRHPLGYHFGTESILIPLAEWDGSSTEVSSTTAKLLSMKLATSAVTVLQNDLLTLVKTAIADASVIKYFMHFYGYGSKIAGILGVHTAGAVERSCVITYDGSTWTATNANSRFNYIQEAIEPVWLADDTFYGWLTSGHGTNSHYIKYSDLSVNAVIVNSTNYSTQPIYDMINHKIVWLEGGSGIGSKQYIITADPDITLGHTNQQDKTPTGTLVDNESNSWDLNKTGKVDGNIYTDLTNSWFVLGGINNPGYNRFRTFKTTLGTYDVDANYALLQNSSGNDKIYCNSPTRCINQETKLLEPNPILPLVPQSL